MLALVDCNNFYVSCERVFRPDLQQVPVAVLSSNDGCIVARSAEVKALGIPMGVPVFKVRSLVQEHNIHLFSSNYALYTDMSARVMRILADMCLKMEVYSIDEAFLDVGPLSCEEAYVLGKEIKEQGNQWLGLPLSVGMAPTKVLAKVANDYAKREQSGVYVLGSEESITEALRAFPVDEVWGVGRRLAARLKSFGIYTANDLRLCDAKWVRRHFTVVEERLVLELQGIPCLQVGDANHARKSIQVSRSFSRPLTTQEELMEAIATFTSRAGEKLRSHHLQAGALLVYIQSNPYASGAFFYHSASLPLPLGCQDTFQLLRTARKVLQKIFVPGKAYRKAGVMLLDLRRVGEVQLDFFCPLQPQRTEELTRIMDQLNRRYGARTLFLASCGMQQDWLPRAEARSPCYTTEWDDLPIVKAH